MVNLNKTIRRAVTRTYVWMKVIESIHCCCGLHKKKADGLYCYGLCKNKADGLYCYGLRKGKG